MEKGELSSIAIKAKKMRKELKETFPGVKFTVRSDNFSGGSSIDVSWVDFPSVKAVRERTSKYESLRRDNVTGEILSGGNDYISENQKLSDELRSKAEDRIPEDVYDNQRHYWVQIEIEEMYEEVKGLYQLTFKPIDKVQITKSPG